MKKYLLSEWLREKIPAPCKIVTMPSIAMMNACLTIFNHFQFEKYNSMCFEFLEEQFDCRKPKLF